MTNERNTEIQGVVLAPAVVFGNKQFVRLSDLLGLREKWAALCMAHKDSLPDVARGLALACKDLETLIDESRSASLESHATALSFGNDPLT